MIFESRKLYSHGQNENIFLLQIPKLVAQDMQLSKDTLVSLDYRDGKIIIEKQEKK